MKKATSEQLLKQHGLKVTATRKDVLNALMVAKKPMTVEVLQAVLGKKADTATTYRTLQTLATQGLVYQTNFRDRRAHYEYQKKHHHHVVCTICGAREETKTCVDTKKLARTLTSFKTLNSHVLEFFGVCNRCAA